MSDQGGDEERVSHNSGLVSVDGAPLKLKPSRKALSDATAVPFEQWAHARNAQREVRRHEMLSLLKAFVGPLQDGMVQQQRVIARLSRPAWRRAWDWLRAPRDGGGR